MNLQEWRQRKNAGEEATLPSGLEIRVRRVSLPDLAAQGKIPQTLQPNIELFMKFETGQAPTLTQLGEMAPVLDMICRACIVGPEGLDVAELEFPDKMAIVNWANEVAVSLKTFRQEPVESLGVGRTGEALRAEAVNGVGAVG